MTHNSTLSADTIESYNVLLTGFVFDQIGDWINMGTIQNFGD